MRPHKRSGDVRMDEAIGIRWLVEGGVVCMTDGIGRGAGSASIETAVSEGWRRIGGNGGQRT
eukprot:2721010-Pleurochrysis_carterae.AAC.1